MAERESVAVHDAEEQSRYEARIGGTLAGFAEYKTAGGDRVFTHTEVFDEFEGKGVGGALARSALDDVKAKGLKARPLCPFIAGWIRRHPEYVELVADGYRDRVTEKS
ncbi:hypothetical protein EV193_104548 [Herbihabitans rhizosphaerae]|uniref:N-acetyltransferase domain-containing protein n=1 Tax=Herbihabitans rhizosphaerae TaxID=1872711 RepID=A0A4Q7KU10_9PSEU|nr:GNAT family N-acetyltransferase [Herbihabitans rhizosphaerae]RZS39331.1 hypothetical protein EV193_104548 [Herbihabitans rhizosphaerae]